jgi:hypothetical protein
MFSLSNAKDCATFGNQAEGSLGLDDFVVHPLRNALSPRNICSWAASGLAFGPRLPAGSTPPIAFRTDNNATPNGRAALAQ